MKMKKIIRVLILLDLFIALLVFFDKYCDVYHSNRTETGLLVRVNNSMLCAICNLSPAETICFELTNLLLTTCILFLLEDGLLARKIGDFFSKTCEILNSIKDIIIELIRNRR